MSVAKPVLSVLAGLSLLILPASASAQDTETSGSGETVGQIIDRILRETKDSRKAVAETGRDVTERAEDALVDSDLVGGMADLMEELADKFEVERGEGAGTALLFEGEELLRLRRDLDRAIDDRVTISGLGRNLSVERETVTKNGKTKTRIVIEMDGGEGLEIDLPAARDEPKDTSDLDQE